jgi:DNA polymerase-3 subunit delta
VVLLLGPQATLRDAALAELRRRASGGAPTDFAEDRFDFAEPGTDPERVLTALLTPPFLAPVRLVRVRGLGDRRAARFLDEDLPAYLERPSPTTCLVLEAESLDRRQRWTKAIAAAAEQVDCTAPSRPADVRAWIERRIRARGRRPGRGVAAALFEAVGPDLDRLANEIDKACLYEEGSPELTLQAVEEVSGGVRPLVVYELTDAIGSRRADLALGLLARLLRQGESPLALLGSLGNHLRRLLRARECDPLEKGEVQRRLALHPFAAEKLVEQARRFDASRLERCLEAVRETDAALKGALPLAPELALERLVLAVCA